MTTFIAVFILSYIWHALGVTVGYHRLLSHRTFRTNKFVEYFFVLAGYLSMEGSPIWWASIHRAHHKYVDTPLDPHSPRFGFYNALFGWLTRETYPDHIVPAVQCPDLVKDPIYSFLERGGKLNQGHAMGFAFCILFRIVLLLTFGWVVALASMLAAVAVLQIPLMLNVVCHMPRLGYKNFESSDDSTNVWWVGLLALGEGWHNNHHAFPGSCRNGMRWFELDLSYLTIKALAFFGLVTFINEISAESLEKRAIKTRVIAVKQLQHQR